MAASDVYWRRGCRSHVMRDAEFRCYILFRLPCPKLYPGHLFLVDGDTVGLYVTVIYG
jgi:hypothetical protein